MYVLKNMINFVPTFVKMFFEEMYTGQADMKPMFWGENFVFI